MQKNNGPRLTIRSNNARKKNTQKGFKLRLFPPSKITIRYALIRTIIGIIDGARSLGKSAGYLLRPILRIIGKTAKILFFSSILNGYFAFLKMRKKSRATLAAGQHRVLKLFNAYMYKFTIAVIVLVTVIYNFSSRNISAEELQTSILINQAIGNENDLSVTLIEEGPLNPSSEALAQLYGNSNSFLAQDLISTVYAPDTDDDDIYATAEGDSSIIAPIITDTNIAGQGTRNSVESYIVQSGDSISTIAQKFALSTNTILWQNNLTWNSTIRTGQEIIILPIDGLQHSVASGETLGAIAKKYQAELDEIISTNKLADANDIVIGEKLIIPDGIKPSAVAVRPRNTIVSIPSAIKDIFSTSAPVDGGTRLLWPLNSRRITQYYHLRHSGVDIGDTRGNAIYAAESGKVERSGWIRGYGYNVIINHGGGMKTLYGHATQLLVSAGQTVSRGQTIATIGSTGWSTGPHLHFEVIINGRKVNPFNYTR